LFHSAKIHQNFNNPTKKHLFFLYLFYCSFVTNEITMKHGSLFSGIGGFELAASWCGWENVFHCENNPFGQKILKHHFPNSKHYEDITTFDATNYAGRIDIISGGFPCQPFSTAGKRKGTDDERYLWKEMLRIIREVSPSYVVGENVRGLVNWNEGLVFETVCADLENEGYEVVPFILPAAAVNAPHRRDRVWFIAYSNKYNDTNIKRQNKEKDGLQKFNREAVYPWKSNGTTTIQGNATDTDEIGLQRRNSCGTNGWSVQTERIEASSEPRSWEEFPTQSPFCGGDDGIPRELDSITFSKWRKESIKAYGNAIVPQVAYQIFKAIIETERRMVEVL
jgi:DNA (cytosine-5)-methyltransferase 1